MSCDRFKEEMFDYLGFDILPESLEKHLIECSECRIFWNELNNYSNHLGNDEDFKLNDTTVDEMVLEVNAQINRLEIEKPENQEKLENPVKIINYLLPIAASILILLGISISSGYLKDSEQDIVNNFSGDLYFQFGQYLEEDDEEMDVQFVDELLNDYSTSSTSAPGEQLLNDLTDEEMEYLKTNFDAGDILL